MKLNKEFSDFYSYIRIDSETNALKEKRDVLQKDIEEKFPQILNDHGIDLVKSDIKIIDQGSYKYNTTIKADIVDRDVAVIIPLDTRKNNDPILIKKYLRDAINLHSREIDIKEPCVTVSYSENGEKWLHIDLPCYAKDQSIVYLARGKEFSDRYSWEIADPEGLNNYFCNKINGHDQLRRIICYIKKWRNEKYSGSLNDHEVPPSIGLTYLACNCYIEQSYLDEEDDLLALLNTMESIKNGMSCSYNEKGEIISVDIKCNLPVEPFTDIFAKMKKSNNYMLTFYNRLDNAVENLKNAVNVESEHDAAIYVQKVLGDEFKIPEKCSTETSAYNRQEHNFG